jgi:phosphoglycolate phosphatase
MYSEVVAQWRGQWLQGVLFDLDGTLLDTAADIAFALNRTLLEFGLLPAPQSEVRKMVGRGSQVLIERAAAAQGRALDEHLQRVMVERFFHFYGELEEANEDTAQTYVGAADALRVLHDAGLRIAVVTNKQYRFAEALLRRRGLSPCIDVVVGGDTCARRKPDPQPLLFACESIRVTPRQALMVGDSINDVQAARAAGIPVVCVSYGYNEGRDPQTLECDALIDTLADLPRLLQVKGSR